MSTAQIRRSTRKKSKVILHSEEEAQDANDDDDDDYQERPKATPRRAKSQRRGGEEEEEEAQQAGTTKKTRKKNDNKHPEKAKKSKQPNKPKESGKRSKDKGGAKAKKPRKKKEKKPSGPQASNDVRAAYHGLATATSTPTRENMEAVNTTDVRGPRYTNSADELAAVLAARIKTQAAKSTAAAAGAAPSAEPSGTVHVESATPNIHPEAAKFVVAFADSLIETRDKCVHELRQVIEEVLRAFAEMMQCSLNTAEARHEWFALTPGERKSICSALITVLNGGKLNRISCMSDALWNSYCVAAKLCADVSKESRDGWNHIINSAPFEEIVTAILAAWRSSNLATLGANLNLITDRQGTKLLRAILASITQREDFVGPVLEEWKLYKTTCKEYGRFAMATKLACFPEHVAKPDGEEEQDALSADSDDDDDDDNDADQHDHGAETDEPDEEDVDEEEENIKDTMVTKGDPTPVEADMLAKIPNFKRMFNSVIRDLVQKVKALFPGCKVPGGKNHKPIELPAKTPRNRRMVIFAMHPLLDASQINGTRHFWEKAVDGKHSVPLPAPSGFRGDDAVEIIKDRLYMGGEGAMLHVDALGITAILHCAAEAPLYCAGRDGIEHLALNIARDADTIPREVLGAALKFLGPNRKTLVLSADGNSRCAAIILAELLQREMNPQDALKLIHNAHPGTNISPALFDAVMNYFHRAHEITYHECYTEWFEEKMAPALNNVSFKRTKKAFRVKDEADASFSGVSLTALHTSTSESSQHAFVDNVVEVGLGKHCVPSAVRFAAKHIMSELAHIGGPVLLVPYPRPNPADESPMVAVAKSICNLDRENKYTYDARVLWREEAVPERDAKGRENSAATEYESLLSAKERHDTATYVILDDVLGTGSTLLAAARELNVPPARLYAVVIGRWRNPDGQWLQSPHIVADDVPVEEEIDTLLAIDLGDECPVPETAKRIIQKPSHRVAVFATHKAAVEAATALLKAGYKCVPHFALENVGWPCKQVEPCPNLLKPQRALPLAMFVEKHTAGKAGKHLRAAMEAAHKRWAKFDEDDPERRECEEMSVRPLSADELNHVREALKEARKDGCKIVDAGYIQCPSKKMAKDLLRNHQLFAPLGLGVAWAHGRVRKRIWIPVGEEAANSAKRIAEMATNGVIHTLNGQFVTAKVVSKHEGGEMIVTEKAVQMRCPQLKRSPAMTWTPTMMFLNKQFLSWVTNLALRRVWEERVMVPNAKGVLEPDQAKVKQELPHLEGALDLMLQSLTEAGFKTFDGMSALEARDVIVKGVTGPLKSESGLNYKRAHVEACEGTLAAWHFSLQDLARGVRQDHRLCGLSTAGSRLVHLGIHLPGAPFRCKTEAAKTSYSTRELAKQCWEAYPVTRKHAENRIAVVVHELPGLVKRTVSTDEKGQTVDTLRPVEHLLTLTTKILEEEEAKAACEAMQKISDVLVRYLRQLQRYVDEMRSWDAADDMRSVVALELTLALDRCRPSLEAMGGVEWPKYTPEELSEQRKKKPKTKLGDGAGPYDTIKNAAFRALNRARDLHKFLHDTVASYIRPGITRDTVQIPNVTPEQAADSVRPAGMAIILGEDGGASGSCFSAIAEPLAAVIYTEGHKHNRASKASSDRYNAAGEMRPLFKDDIWLTEMSASFTVGEGVANEASHRKRQEQARATYKKAECTRMRNQCMEALTRPDLSLAARRVAQLMLQTAGTNNDSSSTAIMDFPHQFASSASPTIALRRIRHALLMSAPVMEAYNVDLYRHARSDARRSEDKIASMLVNYAELLAWLCSVDPVFRLMHVASHEANVDIKEEFRRIWLLEPQGKRKGQLEEIYRQCPDEQAAQMSYLLVQGSHVLKSNAQSYVRYSKEEAHNVLMEARRLPLQDRFTSDAAIYACQKFRANDRFDVEHYLEGVRARDPNLPVQPGQQPATSCVDLSQVLEEMRKTPREGRLAVLVYWAWCAIATISGNADVEKLIASPDLPAFLRVDPDVPPSVLFADGKWNRKAPAGARWRSGWHRAKHRKAKVRVLRRRAKWQQHRARYKNHPPDAGGGTGPTAAKPQLPIAFITYKLISEVRTTRQLGTRLQTILTREQVNTCAPRRSKEFRNLAHDAPWKLRTAPAKYFRPEEPVTAEEMARPKRYIVQRDHLASFAIAWIAWWERQAGAYNKFATLHDNADPLDLLLPRPAAWLFHTHYKAWLSEAGCDVSKTFQGDR